MPKLGGPCLILHAPMQEHEGGCRIVSYVPIYFGVGWGEVVTGNGFAAPVPLPLQSGLALLDPPFHSNCAFADCFVDASRQTGWKCVSAVRPEVDPRCYFYYFVGRVGSSSVASLKYGRAWCTPGRVYTELSRGEGGDSGL